MKASGFEIKKGKHISFKSNEQQRFTRGKTIGVDYTEERIKERLLAPKAKTMIPKQDKDSILKMLDLNKPKFKESKGLSQWAKLHNLKIASQTMIILEQKGLLNLEEFDNRYEDCDKRFTKVKTDLKQNESRIKMLKELKQHLQTYGRTKEYSQTFEKSRNKDKFLRDNPSCESQIMLHEASKRFLDQYRKEHKNSIMTVKAVNIELSKLEPLYAKQILDYKRTKAEQSELMKLYSNLQTILGEDMKKIRNEKER